ncbi:putative holin-like toxin [Brevibacillus laterosporus]
MSRPFEGTVFCTETVRCGNILRSFETPMIMFAFGTFIIALITLYP